MAEQMVTILDRENTLLNRFIAQMRDINIQGDSMRFRRNLERAGEVMALRSAKRWSTNRNWLRLLWEKPK